jgi:OOP family OmpA-OmpF porin
MGSTPADLKHDSEYDPDRDELAELRALLLGQQVIELQALQQRLDDPSIRSEEISQVLGKAVALSIKRDGGLQRSLYPVVEQALKISVAKNPAILATSLAPLIGDAVRKAVASALRGMAESINFTLERSLSWEGLKWRLEAKRTGKSFGEIVLLRNLRYKVQQVVLIHRETGSMLQYVRAPGEGIREAELVSSMLTAIGDFVTDAFSAQRSQEFEETRTNDFILLVHHGPQASLAGTILGTPPPELKHVFARENELIHQEFAVALASFKGDASVFDGARPHLQNCLLGHTTSPQRQSRRWLVPVAAVLLVIAALGFLAYRRNSHWSHYIAQVQRQPGVVLTGWKKDWGRYQLSGLRDPLAPDPANIASRFGIDPAKVEEHFEPYQSLDEPFALQRVFESEKQAVEGSMILFPVNSSALMPDQSVRMDWLEEHLDKLQQAAASLDRKVHITIYGRADQTGGGGTNATLSRERAEQVLAALRERGVPPESLSVVALGNSEPIRHGSEAYQLEVNRSVSLKVESQPQGDRQ